MGGRHIARENQEGFHFAVAAPQERGEKQELATTPVGMTCFDWRRMTARKWLA